VLESHGISFSAVMNIVASTVETLATFQRVFMFLQPVEHDQSFAYRIPGVSEAERNSDLALVSYCSEFNMTSANNVGMC